MTDAVAFWGAANIIAALALPLCFRLFARFPDAGAGLSYSLGLVVVSTVYFLLRVVGAIPAGRGGVLLTIAVVGLAMVVLAPRDRRFHAILRRSLPSLVITIGLFSALFFGYAFFRAHASSIVHTEQPMDFMYLNAMLVSPEYPPEDPWFAGEKANYYYGGYLQTAILTSASGVWPATGYNLSLGAVFAASGAAVAALCATLARWTLGARSWRWTFASAAGGLLLLLFSGPLASIFELAAAHGASSERVFSAFGVEGLVRCEPGPMDSCAGRYLDTSGTWYPDDWWPFWRMSWMANWERQPAYPDTFTEAPSVSFIVGDLHPHVMAIPGVLLALAMAASLWRGHGPLSWREHMRRPWILVGTAMCFGALAFVNTWDVFGLSAILAAATFARNFRSARSARAAVVPTVSWLAPPAILAVFMFAPWILSLSDPTGGLYAYVGRGTRIEHALLFWGVIIALALPAPGSAFALRGRSPLRSLAAAFVLPMLPITVWIVLVTAGRAAGVLSEDASFGAAVESRGAGGWFTLAFYAVALWLLGAAALVLASTRHAAAVVAAFAALGVLLLYCTELLFIRDALFQIPRTNTVFKLSYEAWIVLSVASPVALVVALRRARLRRRLLLGLPVAILLASSLVFAVIAVPNRAASGEGHVTLDGLHWLDYWYPAEYALVEWLAANVPHDAIVVEASGRVWERGDDRVPVVVADDRAYAPFGRVAFRTGLRVPVGWPGHELQWRGEKVRDEINRRRDLVDRVYTAVSEEEVLAALRELGATYVVLGVEESERYRDGLIPPFETFLDTVFAHGGVRVFRIPVSDVVTTR